MSLVATLPRNSFSLKKSCNPLLKSVSVRVSFEEEVNNELTITNTIIYPNRESNQKAFLIFLQENQYEF
jgi:hypothetical protein